MTGVDDAPPIPGFDLLGALGSGGFADVYLYEQRMPRRRVAIKVLRDRNISLESQRTFESEANVMAELSTHPYIVTVHAASVTADGRPFLVMEYYPGPSLGRRYRQQALPVDEALRIGVQMCGATETAHRSGILHRDLKPANILTSAYGRPGLTDFGISVVKGRAASVEGMSVPWSPPEMLDDRGEADERSDIYSLAATIFSLLAGRSPFEVPGGRNDAMALTARIHEGSPPRLGRADVPSSLERTLQVAMAKTPATRPATAVELGRQLQEIEAQLRLNRTEIDVVVGPGEWASGNPASSSADPDGTRFRAPRTVDADTRLRGVAGDEPGTRQRPRSVDPLGAGSRPAEPEAGGVGDVEVPRGRPVKLALAAGVVGVAAVGGAIALAVSGGPSEPSQAEPTPTSVVDLNEETDLAPPTEVAVTRAGGGASASWPRPPDWQDGDWYVYSTATTDGASTWTRIDGEGPVTLAEAPADGQVCVKVSHRRDGAESPPTVGCTG